MNPLFRPEVMRSRRTGALVGQLRLPPKRNQVACALGAVAFAAALLAAASHIEHTHVLTMAGVIGEQFQCPDQGGSSASVKHAAEGGRNRVGRDHGDAGARVAVPVCLRLRLNAPSHGSLHSGMAVRVWGHGLAMDEPIDGALVLPQAAEQSRPPPTNFGDVEIGLAVESRSAEEFNRDGFLSAGRAVSIDVSIRRMTLLEWLLESLDANPGDRGAFGVGSDGRGVA